MSRKFILATAMAALSLGFTAGGDAAFAQTTDTVSVKVSYTDLNLSSDAGAKVMLQRIVNAARTICGPEPTAPLDGVGYARCVKGTTDRAVAEFDNPNLTAVNRGQKTPASNRLAATR